MRSSRLFFHRNWAAFNKWAQNDWIPVYCCHCYLCQRGSVTAGTAGITPCCSSKKQEILENIKETWFNDAKHSQRLSVCELNQYFCVNAQKNGSRTGGFWPLNNQNTVPCVALRVWLTLIFTQALWALKHEFPLITVSDSWAHSWWLSEWPCSFAICPVAKHRFGFVALPWTRQAGDSGPCGRVVAKSQNHSSCAQDEHWKRISDPRITARNVLQL